MEAGDLATGSGRLHHALKTLRLKWEATQEEWNDVRRTEFEQRYLEVLDPQVVNTLQKMNRLAQLFVQARHDCT